MFRPLLSIAIANLLAAAVGPYVCRPVPNHIALDPAPAHRRRFTGIAAARRAAVQRRNRARHRNMLKRRKT